MYIPTNSDLKNPHKLISKLDIKCVSDLLICFWIACHNKIIFYVFAF